MDVDTVRLIVSIILFVAIFFPNPYGYYVFSRWIICGFCLYYVFEAVKTRKVFWAFVFGIVAISNNPILPIQWDSAWLVPYFASMILLMWGVQYAGLDEIGLLIAKSYIKGKLGDDKAQSEAEGSASASNSDGFEVPEPVELKPSRNLKQLYREAAKSFHPDLVTDEKERERRHRFMAEANRAFHDRNEDRLRDILSEWKCSLDAGSLTNESDTEPERDELFKEMAEEESISTELSDSDMVTENISGEIRTILVVEDCKDTCELICNFMRFLGHNVVFAYNGRDGLEKYFEVKPDLVITNLNMGAPNGLQLLRAIRKEDLITPVILESGNLWIRRAIPGFDELFDAVIEKPFKLEEMLKYVEELLSLSRQELEKRHRDRECFYYPRQSEEPVEQSSEESAAESEVELSVDMEPEDDESEDDYISKDDLDAIYKNFDGEIIEAELEDAEALIQKGLELFNLGHYDEALRAFERAVQLQPDNADAWHSKGMALFKFGRHDEALQAFEKAVQLQPGYAEAWDAKGLMLRMLGRDTEALQAYERMIQLDSDCAEGWNGKANTLYGLGRSDEALQAFKKAIQLRPDDSDSWHNMSAAFADLGRYDEALKCSEKAIQLKPDYAEAWKDKGWWLHHLGRYDDALHAYKRAIQLRPDYILAWGLNGVTLQNLGRFAEALQAFEKATQLDPDNAVAWYSLAQCHALLKQKEGTLTALKRAISLYSSFRKEARIDPNFENLWNDKDFKRLVKRASWWR